VHEGDRLSESIRAWKVGRLQRHCWIFDGSCLGVLFGASAIDARSFHASMLVQYSSKRASGDLCTPAQMPDSRVESPAGLLLFGAWQILNPCGGERFLPQPKLRHSNCFPVDSQRPAQHPGVSEVACAHRGGAVQLPRPCCLWVTCSSRPKAVVRRCHECSERSHGSCRQRHRRHRLPCVHHARPRRAFYESLH